MNDLQAMEELWYLQQRQQEWSTGRLFQRAQLPRATPQVMDALWADGWRHFGPEFFRDKYSLDGSRLQKIIPLRVALARFSPRRDQRRTLKRSFTRPMICAMVSLVCAPGSKNPSAR